MPNLISLLKSRLIEDLNLPNSLEEKVKAEGIKTLWDLFSLVQKMKADPDSPDSNLSQNEVQSLNTILKNYLATSPSDKTSKPEVSTPSQERSKASQSSIASVATKSQRIVGKELLEKELFYSSKLRNVELVGEIPVSPDELSILGGLFRKVFSQSPIKTALGAIEKDAPASFAVFLVGQGVYGYNGGDYWTSVEQALDCKTGFVFGQTFERILRHYRLATFEELQKKSARYVSLILAHGGIPAYSLDDYFSNYILTSISRPQYMGLDSEEVLSALLSSSAAITTDKPVTHFLEYGGRVALDIFNRSRHLFVQWQDGQSVPDVDEAGLPRHMVERFAEWVKTIGVVSSTSRSSKKGVHKPELCLDPWGLGVFLKLPSQSVPVLDASDCSWKIQTMNDIQDIPVEIDAQGYTREITIRVDHVSEAYNVKFIQGDKEFEWNFNSSNSIFVFDPDQETYSPRFSNNEVWVVYPNQLELKITDGDGYQTEELPSLPGNWNTMKADGWELTNAREVTFFSQDAPVKAFEIKQMEWIQPPFLTGGTILQNNLEDSASIYVGKPPRIRIPVRDGIEIPDLLERWRISIKPVGFADPQYPKQARLSDLPDTALSISGNGVEILLEHASLLNIRPAGVFQIMLWGPLGQDAGFQISCWPECDISGIGELYIPDRQGAQPVHVEIQTGLLDQIETFDDKDELRVHTTRPGLFSVSVPAEKSRVHLQIFHDSHEGILGIPLEFRVKRLRWRLVAHDVVEGWSDDLLEVGIDQFAQTKSPLLIISWPDLDYESVELHLRLLDLNSNELLKIKPAKGSTRRSGDFWRFDLDVLQSNLVENRAPILRLELIAQGITGDIQKQLPVISFTRSINVQKISVDLQEDETRYHLNLGWYEPSPLQNRCVYVWSLWRPWEPVRCIDIPDDAQNQYTFSLDKEELLAGEYRLAFAIVDPWVNTPPPVHPPDQNSPGAIDFGAVPEQRFDYLKNHAKTFDEHLELLLVSKSNQAGDNVQWCLSNLKGASGGQILILKDYLDNLAENSITEQFGKKVIFAGIMDMLLKEIKLGRLTSSNLSSILEYAPPIDQWDISSCELLLKFDDRRWRSKALQHLISKRPELAAGETLSMIKKGFIDIEDAVEIMFENRPRIIESLKLGYPNDAIAGKVVEFLQLYNPYSGLPMVRVGTWVRTDAGWGKIESIQDLVSHTSVDEFMENQGVYKLVVRLHIEIDPGLQGEKAVIDMKQGTLTFQRAKSTYICGHCQEFMSTNRNIYKFHIAQKHPGQYPSTPTSQTSFTYTFLEFVHSRK